MAAPLSHPVASRRCYRGDYAVHSHAHAQMLFGLSGTLDLDLAGRAARVEPGVALVMPPGTAHAYRALRPMQALVIDAPAQRSLERVRLLAFGVTLSLSIITEKASLPWARWRFTSTFIT